MGILSKKRSDGILVRDLDPYAMLLPYVMRGRNESAVYYSKSIDITPALEYLADRKEQSDYITVFNLIIAAIKRTVEKRPKLNRYIAGRRLYQHKNFEVLYVVKRSLTDSAGDSIAKVVLDPADDIRAVAQKVNEHNKELKQGLEKGDDMLMKLTAWMPRWLLRFLVSMVRVLDFHGLLPHALIDILPFYSSIWISNLGSIGADAPFHHLYEIGTTSIFLTIGRIQEKTVHTESGDVNRKYINLMFTIDERVCDGFYLIRSLRLFERFMAKPQLIDRPSSDEESAKNLSSF
ncbi:MAG: 2-oxo acid dehydrogenase subunit E2 [Clostridia bacterium]|nr:2-oxo acid dehydrogenase subunit E2 [Clostridia bacterium]